MAHVVGELGDEFVVDGRLDVDPFDRHAYLTGVEHPAPRDAVGGAFEIGVGQHHRGILAAEFEAVRDQALRTRHGNLAAGGRRTGEVDVIGIGDHGGTGLGVAGGQGEHRRRADLGPSADELDGA